MSNTFLSFGSIAKLHNNSAITVSPIGELSNKARTYCKDPAVFGAVTDSPTILFNFYSSNGTADIVMPTAIAQRQIAISDWLYDQAKKGNLNDNEASCLAMLKTQFTVDIEFLAVGDMVTDSTIYLPSMVHGNHIETVDGQPVRHEFYLWFADEYFRRQYPNIIFTIIHPIPLAEIDSLMEMNYQQIKARFDEETPDVIQKRTDELTNNNAYPYTARGVRPFEIMDDVNETSVLGYWRYISWGNDLDSEDALFEKIREEILATSKYPLADWEEKIPDLFNPVEYLAYPDYTRKGITNLTNETSTLSPMVREDVRRILVDRYAKPYTTEEHIIESLVYVPFMYKSANIAFVGKPTNRPGYKNLADVYTDYQLIPSLDSDFGMMEPVTRDFINTIELLLAAAWVVTPTSSVPIGVSRIVRNGSTYVSKTVGVTRIVMLVRHQLIQDGLITEE